MAAAGGTLLDLFRDRVEERANDVALRTKRAGKWAGMTWREWERRARCVAAALVEAGVQKGDRVAIFVTTREEWVIADVAIMFAGGVTVPIYPTLVGDQVEYILADSGARVLFAENPSYVARVAAEPRGRETLRALARVVVIDDAPGGEAGVATTRWADLYGHEPLASEDPSRALAPDDLATIVYTSGTTGPPKGAMLTHAGFVFETEALAEVVEIEASDEQLLFLPMAHIFGKMLVAMQLRVGYVTSFAESILKALDNAAEVNPTFMGCVPRLYEKIYAVANDKAKEGGAVKRAVFDWAVRAGRASVENGQRGLGARWADKLVLSKIRARFGNRLRFAISGGAPLAKELAEWFAGAGVLVLEAYGLTEVTGASNINTRQLHRFGTVGPVLPGVEVKIASDGEVLIRGPNVMRGYWKNEEATREVIDADGWFHSGDVGAFDEDGCLRITDRKKDIIVTAGGKNVAPQNIENLLKQSPWISHAMVHGDARPYLVALVTLNPEAMARFAAETGRANDAAQLAEDPDLLAQVQREIDAMNARLSKFETIKRFAVLPRDFSIDGGELTPTLKVKRKLVIERHRALLDRLYD